MPQRWPSDLTIAMGGRSQPEVRGLAVGTQSMGYKHFLASCQNTQKSRSILFDTSRLARSSAWPSDLTLGSPASRSASWRALRSS